MWHETSYQVRPFHLLGINVFLFGCYPQRLLRLKFCVIQIKLFMWAFASVFIQLSHGVHGASSQRTNLCHAEF